jgi:hypothetical protein
VQLSADGMPWSTAIVKQIGDGEATFFCPYGTTAGFTHSGGVICYVGIDEFKCALSDSARFPTGAPFAVLPHAR